MANLDILEPYQLSQKHYGGSGTTEHMRENHNELPQSVYTSFPCLEHSLLHRHAVPSNFRMALNHYRARQLGAPCPDKTG